MFTLVSLLAATAAAKIPLIDIGRPYLVPQVPQPDDYGAIVYLDPGAASDGDGSLAAPYNAVSSISFTSDTAYLIKAGTTIEGQSLRQLPPNIYVGRYGEGDNPVLFNGWLSAPTDFVMVGVDIEKDGVTSYDEVFDADAGARDVMFVGCRIIGRNVLHGRYPYYLMKGGCPGLTFYNCEIAYVRADAFYLSSFPDYTFVGNHFHHINMGNSGGDAVQLEGSSYDNLYFANNYVDRGDTIAKFGLIINSGDGTHDAVCEWNTFIATAPGGGGAGVRWLGGTRNIFRKNLFVTVNGGTGVATFDSQANLPEPYGIRDNHWYGSGSMFFGISTYDPSNLSFPDEQAYIDFLVANSLSAYGSDIFAADAGDAPTVPTNLAASVLLNSVTLTWDASSAGLGLAGYRIFRDGQLVGTATETSYTDAGLALDTTYTYIVRAFDVLGTLSADSTAVVATTASDGDSEAPAPPSGLTAAAEVYALTLNWTAATDNIAVAGYRIVRDGSEQTTTPETTWTDTGLAPGTTYAYEIFAFDAAGNESTAAQIEATTGSYNLPSGWTYEDVGSVGFEGSVDHYNGEFTINASGADIFNSADSFGFVWTTLSGDGTMTARVTSVEETNGWAKCGLMFRETLDPDARHASLFLIPSGKRSFQRRTVAGGGSSSTTTDDTVPFPHWIRLVRSGDHFAGYASADGVIWTLVGQTDISMPQGIFVGLALTAHDNGKLNTSAIDQISIEGHSGIAAPPALSWDFVEGQPALRWLGDASLEEASDPQGPWTPIEPVPASPYLISGGAASPRFFQLRAD